MHLKLLLLSQLLAFSCIMGTTVAHEEETTTEPVITSTLPEVVTEVQATASPDQGFLALDQGQALNENAASKPETTIPPAESTTVVPPPTEKPQQLPAHPPYPHPFPGYPYPYGISFNPLGHPHTAGAESAPKPKADHPDFPYLGYPVLRSPYTPYSPYGSTYFPRHPPSPHYPGFAPGLAYGGPLAPAAKPDEKVTTPKAEKEGEKPEDEQPPQHPSFGYPPLYVIQRRPLQPSYPYAVPARGYGLPFGYGG